LGHVILYVYSTKGDIMSNNPQQLRTPQQLEDIAINQAMKSAHKNPRHDQAQQNCLNALTSMVSVTNITWS
jgi:hypothetical protein